MRQMVFFDWSVILDSLKWSVLQYDILKIMLAAILGAIIGSDRSRHGRAAGMRTHILVCVGACMTSMTSMFVSDILLHEGDVFRVSAQVISGIGFLGAGMIILKSNNVITGLTTAAGIWATGVIGVAIGYGFITGAIISFVMVIITITLFSKFERRKKMTQVFYVEIDDMYQANKVMRDISAMISSEFSFRTMPPRSQKNGNIGLNVIIEKRGDLTVEEICAVDNVVFAIED